MATCSKCRRALPTSAFGVNRTSSSGRRHYCRSCQTQYRREWVLRKNNAERARKSRVRYYELHRPKVLALQKMRAYGLNEEALAQMRQSQRDACAICEIAFSEKRKPNVDHDHATGIVRGVLCHKCNVVLGMASDNPDVLIAAAQYLRRNAAAREVA